MAAGNHMTRTNNPNLTATKLHNTKAYTNNTTYIACDAHIKLNNFLVASHQTLHTAKLKLDASRRLNDWQKSKN